MTTDDVALLVDAAPMPPLRPTNVVRDAIARYWSKVDRSGGSDACWPWMGQRLPSGYGRISWAGEQIAVTHVALAMTGRFVEPGLLACHHCDNPPCVNPQHLFIGTTADNMRDMVAKGRDNPWLRSKQHCKHGHPWSSENTRIGGGDRPDKRRCRTCEAARTAQYKRRRARCPDCGASIQRGSLRRHQAKSCSGAAA